MLTDSKRWISFTKDTLKNPDPSDWFSEDLEARRGILSQLENIDL
jgi:hypothetical protein